MFLPLLLCCKRGMSRTDAATLEVELADGFDHELRLWNMSARFIQETQELLMY